MGKWYTLIKIDMDKMFNLLLQEFQEVKLRLDWVEKQLNKDDMDDRRHHRNNHKEWRDKNNHRLGMTMMTLRVKLSQLSHIDGVHDPQVLNNCLVDMDYFDWYRMFVEHNI